jgi:mannosyltransferase OCH1-like enzyme
MISKIIWQTHNYLYEDLPINFTKATKTWQYLNPGWEYRYFNHIQRDSFVKNRSKDLYKIYLNSSPVTQSDIWRILAVYEFGGVYADMDSVCIKPLDYMLKDYLDEDFISVPRYPNGKVNNAHFAAVKKSKILKNIIQSTIDDEIEDPYWHVWTTFNKHVTEGIPSYFNCEIHSKDFKERFAEYHVDYYGKIISYREYLKNELNLSEDEYLSSLSKDNIIYNMHQ